MDSLYVIAEQFRQVAEMIENAAETGEDLEVLNDTLEAIGGEFEVKAENIAFIIKNNDLKKAEFAARRAVFEKEAETIKSKETALENANERLKKYLCDGMIAVGKQKFKTDNFSFWTKASTPKVVVTGVVPMDYLKVPEPQPDKTAIGKALKEGQSFEWAHLESHDIAQFR